MSTTVLPIQLDDAEAGRVRLDRTVWLLAGALVMATLAIYARSISFQFVNYDDPNYVADVANVQRGLTLSTFRWSLTAVVNGNYAPLLILTELLISTLFGTGPGGFHFLNDVLHSLNVGLAFLVFLRTGIRPWVAAGVAAAWGWHPLRVESVAWVSELKDVLCGFFWLVTVLTYFRYVRRRTIIRYIIVFLSSAAALASKPMAATIPFVLLLLDFYPLRRFTSGTPTRRTMAIVIIEKLPMLLLAVGLSRITMQVQRDTIQNFPVSERLANAAASTLHYLRDTVWPTRLTVFYPHPASLGRQTPVSLTIISASIVVLLTVFCLYRAAKHQPAILIGWLWFVGTLIPVLGFIQVGLQSRADRYTYIPTLGLALAAGWAISTELPKRAAHAWLGMLISTVVLTIVGVLIVATERQLSTWRNTDTLFLHAIAVTDDNYVAYAELANVRMHQGRPAEALALAERAVIIRADKYTTVNYGLALVHMNRDTDALVVFSHAIRADPDNAALRRDTANLLCVLGRDADAEKQFNKSLKLDNDDAETHDNYGSMLATDHRMTEAAEQWSAAVAINPKLANSQAGLARLAYQQGNAQSAISHYRCAIRYGKHPLDPHWALDLAWLEATSPAVSAEEIDDALTRTSEAVPNPESASSLELDTLAAAMARAGQFDRAETVAAMAVDRARSTGNASLAESIRRRMINYKDGKPYIATR